MNTPPSPIAPQVLWPLLRRALGSLPPAGATPAAGAGGAGGANGPPETPGFPASILDHRRDLLFGLTASALTAEGPAGAPNDLTALIDDRVSAALALGGAVTPRSLADWVRAELFFTLPLTTDEWRRTLLLIGDALGRAEQEGRVVPAQDWAVLRPPPPRPGTPTAPAAETAEAAGSTLGVLLDVPTRRLLIGRVRVLRELPDPRVAEWHLLHHACGVTGDELAELYGMSAQEVADTLEAANRLIREAEEAAAPYATP